MIRQITDENELVRLFPLFIQEGNEVGVKVSKLNPDKLWNTLLSCMDHAAIFIDEHEGVLTGAMAIAKIELYWCDDFELTNLLYYVLAEYRKSTIANQLLKAATAYADSVQLPFRLHVESYEDLERKNIYFTRKGFKPCGGSYIWRKNA